MNCKEFVDFMRAYCDGELPVDLKSAFEEKMEACSLCRCFLDGYIKAGNLAREACTGESKPVPEALIQAILSAKSEVAASES